MAYKRYKGFALIELALVVAIVGILAGIAVPNFIRLQARSKQSEAVMNLKSIYAGQRAFFQENKRFSRWTGEIGFEPARNNRYSYFLAQGMLQGRNGTLIDPRTTFNGIQVDTFKYGSSSTFEYLDARTPTACGSVADVVDAPPKFVALAFGNIDDDPTMDEWSVASDPRVFKASGNCTANGNNPAGEPANDQNDVVL